MEFIGETWESAYKLFRQLVRRDGGDGMWNELIQPAIDSQKEDQSPRSRSTVKFVDDHGREVEFPLKLVVDQEFKRPNPST